ncbi:MAG: WYL domain-containing protein [Christensenellaceae bacterium]|nr:WYL domain-containing protein [Christensenellaceae bacterium]
MAGNSNQKIKILYLQQMLLEQTDEEHPLSMDKLLSQLQAMGVTAERKSIYSDIETLRQFGMDICVAKGKNGGYYLASRTFELPELKLLVDSVQASKFITERKSMSLIKKLVSLGSIYEGQLIQRQVLVKNRIKSMNESIYYNVDAIHNGIGQGKKISFRYFEYDMRKNKRFRHGGERYCVSPFALTWDDENYYMIAYDSDAGIIKHYRVDKMDRIQLENLPREGKDKFAQIDMSQYTTRVFSMFTGEERQVTLRIENSLVGVVIDKFGKDVIIGRADEQHFTVSPRVVVSSKFFAWVASLGGQAVITSPRAVAEEYEAYIRDVLTAQQDALK